MKYLRTFEGVQYKDSEQYDWEFDYKINDYVKFIKDEVNGVSNPGLSEQIFQVQSRSDNVTDKMQGGIKHNFYLLNDMDGYTFTWVPEENIRKATEEEVGLFTQTRKYNL